MIRDASPYDAASSKESLVMLETSKARKLREHLAAKGRSSDKQKDKQRWTQSSTLHGPGSYPTSTSPSLTAQKPSFMSRFFFSPAGTPQPSDLVVVKRRRQWSWSRLWRWRKGGPNKVPHEVVAYSSGNQAASSMSSWSWRSLQSKASDYHPNGCQCQSHQHQDQVLDTSYIYGGSSSYSSKASSEVMLRPTMQHHQVTSQTTTHNSPQACHACRSAGLEFTNLQYPPQCGRWPSTTHDKYGIGVVVSVTFAFWNSQPEWFRFGMFIAFAILMFMLLATLLVVALSLYKGISVVGVVAYGVDDLVRGWSSLAHSLVRFFAGR